MPKPGFLPARLTPPGFWKSIPWRNPYLIILTCIILGTGFAVDRVRSTLIAQGTIHYLLTRAMSSANRLSALEWRVLAEGRVSPAVAREQEEAWEDFRELLQDLAEQPAVAARRAGSPTTIQEAYALLLDFQQVMEAQFAALERGDRALALHLDRTRVNPTFERLEVVLGRAQQKTFQNAGQTEVVTRVFTLALVLGALSLTLRVAHERSARHARQMRAERDQLRNRAEYDTLTGLLNREGLFRRYGAQPAGTPFVLVMLDLNNLKFINDLGGHASGDEHIRSVTRHVLSTLPAGALACRWGGDEFVLLLRGSSPEDARRLCALAVETAPEINGLPAFSYGVAPLRGGEPLDRALTLADADMYDQKDRARAALAQALPVRTVEEFVARLERLTVMEEVFREALPIARDLLGFQAAFYFRVDGEGTVREVCFLPAAGVPWPQRDERAAISGGGIVGQVVRSGQLLWSNDYPNDARFRPGPHTPGMKSCAVLPVRHRGQVVGALGIAQLSSWRPITPQVRHVLECLVLHLSNILERQQVVAEVQEALEGGQKALGIALELRDLETAGHTERVVRLAGDLGGALGLDGQALRFLRQGAYLHDLGKLAIPDTVLLKPGRLDPAERALMETHAPRGAEVASHIPGLPREVLGIIRSHHERWDGRGYPDGLAGEAIPLLARVFSVADVYDALTSERPYKCAWTPDEALRELERQSGRQFDPRVIRAFLQLQGGSREAEEPRLSPVE